MPFSHNGDFEQLVEQITDVIYARLNGHADDQAKMCGCTSECFHRCPERMHRVVDAGAARIGLVLGQTASARDWASASSAVNPYGDAQRACLVSTMIFSSNGNGAT